MEHKLQLNCCDGHQTLVRSPYVQGGSTNLREQYIDEVPKSYGLKILIAKVCSWLMVLNAATLRYQKSTP
jgi:hypothetical protein